MAEREPINAPTTDAGSEHYATNPVPPELEGLLERLCLGDLDTAGWQQMAELLRGNRGAAKQYVQAAHYCETLREETASSAPAGDQPTPVPRPAGYGRDPSVRRLDTQGGGWTFSQFLPWGIAVGFAFLAGWVATQPNDRGAESLRIAQARPLPALVTPGRSEPLGRITGLTPVASSDGLLRSLKVGSQLGRGEVFQLTSGAARLEIDGGEVLVQGPAELSAIDTHTVFLRHGSVTVRHPREMTIQTPLAVATSKGGSFAVVAKADTDAIVTAIEGAVAADTAPDRTRCRESEDCSLAAGETCRFERTDADTVTVSLTSTIPSTVLLAWEKTSSSLHEYERTVLADNPLAYWPIYRVRRHRSVLDLTQNGFDGYAIGNWPTELSDVHASQPRGAYFDGESYIESDRKPPIDLRTGFTMESWARVAGGPEYQAVFTSRWVLASDTESEQCFGYTLYAGSNDKWQVWTGSGEYGKNWDQLQTDSSVVRDRWTHISASFEPDQEQGDAFNAVDGWLKIYVDGAQVAEARHRLSLEDFEWPARIGAAEFVPKSLTSWLFKGELRDVAVYDHVLAPEQLRIHAELGRSAI